MSYRRPISDAELLLLLRGADPDGRPIVQTYSPTYQGSLEEAAATLAETDEIVNRGWQYEPDWVRDVPREDAEEALEVEEEVSRMAGDELLKLFGVRSYDRSVIDEELGR